MAYSSSTVTVGYCNITIIDIIMPNCQNNQPCRINLSWNI